MCVIIHRQAGAEIPFNKLKNAVSRNKDGFGLITHLGNGELDVRHEFDPKGNDPEFIQSLLLDAKDHPISLHLRFSTAGEKSMINCHPFKVGNKDEIGRDVHFFHNGTISAFSTRTGPSDTNLFSKAIVQHAVKMAVLAFDEDWYKADSLHQILQYYAGSGSVFTLVDNYEGLMIVNKDLGKDFDGWWASNNSYFDSYGSNSAYSSYSSFRGGSSKSTVNPPRIGSGATTGTTCQIPSKDTTPTTSTKDELNTLLPWDRSGGKAPEIKESAPSTEYEHLTESLLLKREANKIRSFLSFYTHEEKPSNGFVMYKSIGSEKFRDMAGINDLRDLISLDPDDIDDIVDQFPRMASMLIADLLAELYLPDTQNSSAKKIQNAS